MKEPMPEYRAVFVSFILLFLLPSCSLAISKKTNYFERTYLNLAERHHDVSLCYMIPANSVTRNVGILSSNLVSRVPQYARYERASCIKAVAEVSANKELCEKLRPFGSEGVEACLRDTRSKPGISTGLGEAELVLRYLGYDDKSLYEHRVLQKGEQPPDSEDYDSLYRKLGRKLFPYPKRIPTQSFPDFSKGDAHAAQQVYSKFPECEDASNNTRQCHILRCGLVRDEDERIQKCNPLWFQLFVVK